MAALANKKALLDELGVGDEGPLQDFSQPQEMPIARTVENTGITGGLGSAAPTLDQPMPNSPAPATLAPSRDFSRLTGYDKAKFDANKDDAKYQMGGVLSQFDPRQGITPEVLKALNGLGYGTFSGQGDKLSLSGLTDKGRAAKLQGDYKDADFVARFSNPGPNETPQWGYADPVEEAKQAATGSGAGGLDPRLTGDPTAGIQSALANLGNSSYLQALLKQLGMAA